MQPWILAVLFAVVGALCLQSGFFAVITVGITALVWYQRQRTTHLTPPRTRVEQHAAHRKISELRQFLSPHFPKLETLPIELSKTTSYTINKERVFLCLFDEQGNLYHDNMLVYVLLHEYAHVVNADIGHTQSFHATFDTILRRAHSLGLYDPTVPPTDGYCEHRIT